MVGKEHMVASQQEEATVRHTSFIHSATDGCLGCFHILVIANCGAMNLGHRCLLELWFSQGIFLVVELLSKAEREKQTLFINIYVYGTQKNGSDEPICRPGVEA